MCRHTSEIMGGVVSCWLKFTVFFCVSSLSPSRLKVVFVCLCLLQWVLAVLSVTFFFLVLALELPAFLSVPLWFSTNWKIWMKTFPSFVCTNWSMHKHTTLPFPFFFLRLSPPPCFSFPLLLLRALSLLCNNVCTLLRTGLRERHWCVCVRVCWVCSFSFLLFVLCCESLERRDAICVFLCWVTCLSMQVWMHAIVMLCVWVSICQCVRALSCVCV